MTDIENAIQLLKNSPFTCVLAKGEEVYTSQKKGISPMLEFFELGLDLAGFSAADRVVGRAAAFLFAKAKVKAVYAQILSQGAVEIFEKHRIKYFYTTLACCIKNRTNSDLCPMEKAVLDIEDVEKAFEAIKLRLKELCAK